MHSQTAFEADGDADRGRIIALSDGVFAFAVTLMVLTLDVPELEKVSGADMPRAVLDQWPHFMSYALSFLVVAIFWFEHHRTFQYITRHDAGLMWINIAFLFCISFLPFPTDLMGEYPDEPFAVVFYATSMFVTSLVLGVLWWYASSRRHLVHESLHPRRIQHLSRRRVVPPVVFGASIGLSFVSLGAAQLSWALIVPVLYVLARSQQTAER